MEQLEPRNLLAAFVVNTTADSGAGSLRMAIDQSNASGGADTIGFDAGVFATPQTILLGSQLPTITDELTITGPGQDLLTIDAGNGTDNTFNTGDGFRVFEINDGDNSSEFDVTLSGMTLTGGDITGTFGGDPAGRGGGILSMENLTLHASTVRDNAAFLSGNSASGGGIHQRQGTLTITSSTISGNSANNGGGIYNRSTVNVTDSTISGNTSGNTGAGIRNLGTATVTSSTIDGNTASGNGGGLRNTGTANVIRSTISDNTALGGGGLHNNNSLTLDRITISGNTATGDGGGILNLDTLTVTASTITDNSANSGGGIDDRSVATVRSSIVAGNNAVTDANISGVIETDVANLIGGNPKLGPLAHNGGLTKTHMLRVGSGAINAGSSGKLFDQRGAPFARQDGFRVDIGALERQTVAGLSLVVDTTSDVNDGDYGTGNLSLREAISLANGNAGADVVSFDISVFATPQTIDLASQLPTITEDVTINGPGQDLLTIDAGNGVDNTFGTGDGFRIFEIDNGDNTNLINVSLSGMTMTGGDITASFNGDPAGRGGGIRSLENLTLTDSTVSGNASMNLGNGGGIYHRHGTLDISGSTISGNRSPFGGGVQSYGTSTVTGSTISGNTATSAGSGGGIGSSGTLTVTESTISGNTAAFNGGGIDSFGTLTVASSTISGNTAVSAGGGIYINGTATLTGSTISDNTADLSGGGIYKYDGSLSVTNSIVTGNTAMFGSNVNGSLNTNTSNLIGGDSLLGPLADNGGPTQTHALLPGSPAIDAGSSSETFDQRGTPFARHVGGGADIGAFELQTAGTLNLVVDTTSDINDGDFSAGNLSLREAISLSNNSSREYEITFDPIVFGSAQTIQLGSQLPRITDDLIITGPGQDLLTIDGGNGTDGVIDTGDGFRIFEIGDMTNISLVDITLSGMTITGGDVNGNGGGIYNLGNLTLNRTAVSGNATSNGSSSDSGGGIYHGRGTLNINDSSISGNRSFFGGGIQNSVGTLTLRNSTIGENRAGADGGLSNAANATLNIIGSTISGNTSTFGSGGGIGSSGTLNVFSSTITDNTANTSIFSAGGIDVSSGSANLTSTIVAGNSAPSNLDVRGSLGTNDFNLIGGNPMLGPLADNGGPTQTHELLPGSPAINNGSSAETSDQRGLPFLRNDGGGVDIGALERQTLAPSLFVVTTTVDELNYSNANVSLREAINTANILATADTITFHAGVFGSAQTINLLGQLPAITSDVTIAGPGQDLLTIDAGDGVDGQFNTGDGFRIFDIDDGDNSNQLDVALLGMTLTGGDTAGSFVNDPAGRGGAIRSIENLTVIDSTISGNATSSSGNGERGGGIYHKYATLNVSGSTISGNQSGNGGGVHTRTNAFVTDSTINGNWASTGGGLANFGTVSVTSSTISGNTADFGAGFYDRTFSTVTSSTITGNTANSFGGGMYLLFNGGPTNVTNSIVAGNNAPSGPDINGSLNTNSFNLIGGNPMLGPLADNGGPTKTHALLPGSPAINVGSSTETSDQRGLPFLRDDGGGVDIGAYELQTFAPSLFVVTTTVDDLDYSNADVSLREAINTANIFADADTITFDASVFGSAQTIDLNSQLPTITKDLTIIGPGQDRLTIDAGNGADNTFNTGDGFRIFEIDNSDNSNLIDVTLSGLKLSGGDSMGSFLGDAAERGGAIRSRENLTLNDSIVSGNASSGSNASGGGIYHRFGTLNIDDSTISGNRSINAGGIANVGTMLLTSSTISGNTAIISGGGIQNLGTANVTGSTISGNTAGKGGGIQNAGTANVKSSTISGNTAVEAGGIHNGHIANVTGSTISGNTASSIGGGINAEDSLETNVTSSIIAGNSAPFDPNIEGSLDTNTFNLIGGNPMLGPLTDNVGPTKTHALLPGSPAINVGSSTETSDQRGLPFLRDDGGGVDIGAYELQTLAPAFFVVTTTVDELDYSNADVSLREAINSANGSAGADTITFDASVFGSAQTIGLNSQLPTIASDLTIIGPGQDLLTIDAGNGADNTFATGDGFRIFEIDDGDNTNLIDVSLSGMTLTGGDITGSFGGDPAGRGGGIHSLENLTLTDSAVSGNATAGSANSESGGGIFHRFGTLNINGTTISGNRSIHGGGVQSYGTLTVTGSTISGNTAASSGSGGGISSAGSTTVTRSTISGNTAVSHGGGINSSGTLTVTSSTISGNTADRGGGIFKNETTTATVTSSTISGNTADVRGGGIFQYEGTMNLTGSTISGNTADNGGGGIYQYNGTTNVTNSIVAGNTAPSSPEIDGNLNTSSFNLIGGNPMLGPLADNGGPTKTHALLPGSPAINAGSSTETNDQRGFPFLRDDGGGVDIGAFELQTLNLVVDTTSDVSDGDYSAGNFSLREAIDLANTNLGADTITFDTNIFASAQTINLHAQLPTISGDLSITGPGQGLLTIDAGDGVDGVFDTGDGFRIFEIDDSSSNLIDVTLSGLILTGGDVPTGVGNNGGAIRSLENLTLTESTVIGNGAGRNGGGIHHQSGVAHIVRSTVSGNRTNANGGGLNVSGSGTLYLTLSTVSGNTGGIGGGGIFVRVATMHVVSSTISGNTAGGVGGGIYNRATTTINNSIVANSVSSADIENTGTLSGANNLVQDGTGSGLTGTISGPANLGPLADNGGPTKTHALLPGSAALDTGSSTEPFDQRGAPFARNDGNGVDIGAFESQGVDFGDAPLPYPTLLSDNGPYHFPAGPTLGVLRDTEPESFPTFDADGDDNDGTPDDEDGVMFGGISANSTIAALNVTASQAAKVDAWIDFDQDGDWDDAGEQILTSVDVIAGLQTLNYIVPDGIASGDTFARVRISSAGGLAPTGPAADGEVEDYKVNILPSLLPIEVESVIINPDDAVSRSNITKVRVTFNQQVSTPDNAFILSHREFDGTNVTRVPVSNIAVSGPDNTSGKSVFDITFLSGPHVQTRTHHPNSLMDGNYDLEIVAAEVWGENSEPLPMADTYVFGDEEVDKFFRFYGDDDGDRDTDVSDLGAFGATFRKGSNDPEFNLNFDRDGDNDVDVVDLAEFGTRFREQMDFH